jgi:hypothetical protein
VEREPHGSLSGAVEGQRQRVAQRPKGVLQVLEGATHGGDMVLQMPGAKELGWLSAQEGFGIFEADSKDAILAIVTPFFPYYDSDIQEIVPWEAGKQAVLAGARMVAGA